tara:strand:- start:499 stop:732 length:234 start_codon:yes stop_codon:yes gene_type:complete
MAIFSANHRLFKPGQIISEAAIRASWDLWFGYPETIIEPFLDTTTVEESNTYLAEINIPWRVSAVNTVDGSKQWTIA